MHLYMDHVAVIMRQNCHETWKMNSLYRPSFKFMSVRILLEQGKNN